LKLVLTNILQEEVKMNNMQFTKVIAQAWSDPNFLWQLFERPSQALAEQGIAAPDNLNAMLVFSTPEGTFLTVPTKPSHLSSTAQNARPAIEMEESCHVAED